MCLLSRLETPHPRVYRLLSTVLYDKWGLELRPHACILLLLLKGPRPNSRTLYPCIFSGNAW